MTNEKYGNVCLIVGRQNSGKSYVLKNMLDSLKNYDDVIIYDVQNEYSEYYSEPFLDFNEFLKKVENEENKIIIFEEASIFFKHRSSDKIITKMLVNVFHKHNFIFLCFHSIRKIPKYILELSNEIILFKTNDNDDFIQKIFSDEQYKNYLEVNNSEKKYYNKQFSLLD